MPSGPVAFLALRVDNILKAENSVTGNRQFQLLVYACRERWEVRYHIADYAEKIKMVAV
jgi:hypothetical protein